MARDASTYRGARRNKCIREMKFVWGPDWYYGQHRNTPDWFVNGGGDRNNNKAIYVPAERVVHKPATTTGGVHEMLKRGDYAAAVRAFFKRERKATGRGS